MQTPNSEDTRKLSGYREIIVTALRRASRAGESQEVAARWIMEDLTKTGYFFTHPAGAAAAADTRRRALEDAMQACDLTGPAGSGQYGHGFVAMREKARRAILSLIEAGNNFRWHPIATAPRDGTNIIARRVPEDSARSCGGFRTWWGKASHVPLYGWCYRIYEDNPEWEDIDLWRPDEWRFRGDEVDV